MKYQKYFDKANNWFLRYGKTVFDRKKKFLELAPDKYYGEKIYNKLLNKYHSKKQVEKYGSYYNIPSVKKQLYKYQKSEKYKAYRRKYEAKYRQNHRLERSYCSWRITAKPSPVQEIDYLLKRML